MATRDRASAPPDLQGQRGKALPPVRVARRKPHLHAHRYRIIAGLKASRQAPGSSTLIAPSTISRRPSTSTISTRALGVLAEAAPQPCLRNNDRRHEPAWYLVAIKRRQVNNSVRDMPWRRAVSDMRRAPSMLSTARSALSSSVQRRRRPVSTISSAQRHCAYGCPYRQCSAICLRSRKAVLPDAYARTHRSDVARVEPPGSAGGRNNQKRVYLRRRC